TSGTSRATSPSASPACASSSRARSISSSRRSPNAGPLRARGDEPPGERGPLRALRRRVHALDGDAAVGVDDGGDGAGEAGAQDGGAGPAPAGEDGGIGEAEAVLDAAGDDRPARPGGGDEGGGRRGGRAVVRDLDQVGAQRGGRPAGGEQLLALLLDIAGEQDA